MTSILQDLRHGVRQLVRQPGFTSVAVLTLALGIGATTGLFSIVRGTLLAPLPFPEADRVVAPVAIAASGGYGAVTYADHLDWRAQREVFESVAVFQPTGVNLAGEGEPERATAALITPGFFEALGVRPFLGRAFTEEEHAAAVPGSVVLGEGLWRRRYGADPAIVGRAVRVNGAPRTVVGVLGREARWPLDAELWSPVPLGAWSVRDLTRRDNYIWQAVARLRPGVTLDAASARVASAVRAAALEHPEADRTRSAGVIPLQAWLVDGGLRRALLVLLGATGIVLLVACVNVAGLLLARGASRAREIGVRAALGAGRARLVRQLLTESLLLAATAGAAGVAVASIAVRSFARWAPPGLPRLEDVHVDTPAVAFALAVSAATAALFGLAPALQTVAGAAAAVREGGGRTAGSRRTGAIRGGLVAGQIALSLVLLVGAGLTIRSLARLQRVDPGIRTERAVSMTLSVPSTTHPEPADRARLYSRLVEQVRAVPGVEAAAITSAVPLGGGGLYLGRAFVPEGTPEPLADSEIEGQWNLVSPGWFATSGTPLLRGRDFDDRDATDAPPVAIVTESFARRAFGGGDPLGRRIRSWRDENVLREIVGVVADTRYFGLAQESEPVVFVPHAQDAWGTMLLVVRTRLEPGAIAGAVRAVLSRLDPGIPIADLRTLDEMASASLAAPRTTSALLAAFAVSALALACVGLYGVVAYAAAQRTREIGIRMALGAAARDVRRLVLGQGAGVVGAGLLLGLAGAFAASRVLRGLLYEVSAADPLTFAGLSLLLAAVALAAAWIPARRASRLEPAAALRET
jgi:predicted permease